MRRVDHRERQQPVLEGGRAAGPPSNAGSQSCNISAIARLA